MKPIFFLLLLGISVTVLGQNNGVLIGKNDSLNCSILIKKKKSEYQVYFRKSSSSSWSIIYPENAESAETIEEKYFSRILPGKRTPVWLKCYFDGSMKLLEYRGTFFVEKEEKLIELTRADDNKENSNSKRYIGLMNFLVGDLVNYDLSRLRYSAESLTQPFVMYHKAEGIPYKDYNKYVEVDFNFDADAGLGFESIKLNSETNEEITYGTVRPHLAFGVQFHTSNFPHWLSLRFGLGASYLKLNGVEEIDKINETDYYTVNIDVFTLEAPLLLNFDLLKSNSLNLSLEAGLAVCYNKWGDVGLRSEQQIENNVYTEIVNFKADDHFQLMQVTNAVIEIPSVSTKWGFGLKYWRSLTSYDTSTYDLNKSYSVTLFLRYKF